MKAGRFLRHKFMSHAINGENIVKQKCCSTSKRRNNVKDNTAIKTLGVAKRQELSNITLDNNFQYIYQS